MKAHLTMSVIWTMSMLVWSGCGGRAATAERQQDTSLLPNGARLVAQKRYPELDHIFGLLLAVDRDANIIVVQYVERNGDTEKKDTRVFGSSVRCLIAPGVAAALAKDEEPFAVNRVRSPDGKSVVHFVLTRALPPDHRPGSIFNIHILRESQGKIESLVTDEGDLVFRQFLLEDMDHDGPLDVVVGGMGETGISGWLKMWRVGIQGRLTEIPFSNYKGYSPEVKYGGGTIETTSDRDRTPNGFTYKLYRYAWDSAAARFDLRSSIHVTQDFER
ncbi:MAG TPA: hypothetical protein VGK99_03850 [Acidobacteriota bacterium]|jgi:hypothetical protein